MFGLDFAQDNGDCLRIFVFEVIGKHVLVDIAELIPHGASGRAADFFHNDGNAVFVQSLGQQALGAFIGSDEGAGVGNLFAELLQQLLHHVGVDFAETGHYNGEFLDFFVVHQREQ